MESIDFSTNVNALMERIHNQQAEIERIQREIEAMEVVGASRDDEVRVTVRGNGQVVAVDIDERAVRENDAYELGQLVKDAVNDGMRRVSEASGAKFKPVLDAAESATGV